MLLTALELQLVENKDPEKRAAEMATWSRRILCDSLHWCDVRDDGVCGSTAAAAEQVDVLPLRAGDSAVQARLSQLRHLLLAE